MRMDHVLEENSFRVHTFTSVQTLNLLPTLAETRANVWRLSAADVVVVVWRRDGLRLTGAAGALPPLAPVPLLLLLLLPWRRRGLAALEGHGVKVQTGDASGWWAEIEFLVCLRRGKTRPAVDAVGAAQGVPRQVASVAFFASAPAEVVSAHQGDGLAGRARSAGAVRRRLG